MEENKEENKTYKVKVICGNCDFNDEIEIKKQLPVERHRCPNCDCTSLKKQTNINI